MPQARVSLEEAAKCPKCGKAGKLVAVEPLADGGHVNGYNCDNSLCVWFETGWAVQTDKRGAVYEREIGGRGMDKTFPVMSLDLLAQGQRAVEDAAGKDLRND